MAKIILLCGKVCSGKSTYAKRIKPKYNAVVLSCDELMLELFDEQLGDKHRIVLQKVKKYLYKLAGQIVKTDTNVILDFGFWTCSEREEIKSYYLDKGIETELHYVKVLQDVWISNLEKRNKSMQTAKERSYYIDENMKQLLSKQFEEPNSDEIDVLFYNCDNDV
jgi:predicted kinase